MTNNTTIRVEDVPDCYLCGQEGAPLFSDLPDRLFGAPGTWNLSRCNHCGLVWLNPRPIPEDLNKVYKAYYTHDPVPTKSGMASRRERLKRAILANVSGLNALSTGWGWQLLGTSLGWIPPIRSAARVASMCVTAAHRGRVLDIGCGGGQFLALMRAAGCEVEGLDIDPVSAKLVQQQHGIHVHVGTLQEINLPADSYDAITLHHVIEHVYDPSDYLARCRRLLKPNGQLTIVTPNVESHGQREFRENWRALEPPRHLMLFSLNTMRACVERGGLQIVELWSSARGARRLWAMSHIIREKGSFAEADLNWQLLLRGLWCQIGDELALRHTPDTGEEIVLVATK